MSSGQGAAPSQRDEKSHSSNVASQLRRDSADEVVLDENQVLRRCNHSWLLCEASRKRRRFWTLAVGTVLLHLSAEELQHSDGPENLSPFCSKAVSSMELDLGVDALRSSSTTSGATNPKAKFVRENRTKKKNGRGSRCDYRENNTKKGTVEVPEEREVRRREFLCQGGSGYFLRGVGEKESLL